MAVDRVGPGKVRRPRKVLFDSSFLIAVMEHPTPWQGDILENVGGFEGIVLQPVYAELRRLADRKGRQSRFAKLALGLVESDAVRLEPSEGTRADEELVSHALRDGADRGDDRRRVDPATEGLARGGALPQVRKGRKPAELDSCQNFILGMPRGQGFLWFRYVSTCRARRCSAGSP